MLDEDRCPIVRTYDSREGGDAVQCSLERDHRERYPDEFHYAKDAPLRACWPHGMHTCHAWTMRETPQGLVRAFCVLEPRHGGDEHVGKIGPAPVRWSVDAALRMGAGPRSRSLGVGPRTVEGS